MLYSYCVWFGNIWMTSVPFQYDTYQIDEHPYILKCLYAYSIAEYTVYKKKSEYHIG